MTQQVIIPQRKDHAGQALNLGANVARAYSGDPVAIAQLGQTALASSEGQAPQAPQGAMQRRMGTVQPAANVAQVSPNEDLAKATIALSQLSPEVRAEFETPLRQARLLSQRGVQVGNPGGGTIA